jgi:hypothetical protein
MPTPCQQANDCALVDAQDEQHDGGGVPGVLSAVALPLRLLEKAPRRVPPPQHAIRPRRMSTAESPARPVLSGARSCSPHSAVQCSTDSSMPISRHSLLIREDD